MGSVVELAEAVAGLGRLEHRPAELDEGVQYHAPVDDERRVGVAFNAVEGGWVLSADRTTDGLSERARADFHEALLRHGFDARYGDGMTGARAPDGRVSCSVLLRALPQEGEAVERIFDALLRRLDELAGASAADAASPAAANPFGFDDHWIRP